MKKYFIKLLDFVKAKKFSKKFYIISGIVIICLIGLSMMVFGGKKDKAEKVQYTEGTVQKGNITETIEQSGVVEPYERREIISLAKGEIIESFFEEGDLVEKDDLLYKIDDEDAKLNIEKAELALSDLDEDISNLNIYAPTSGTIADFKLKEGENAPSGVVGTIINNNTLTVNVPFSAFDFSKIKIGDSVVLTSALYMSDFSGRVTHKFDGLSNTSSDGSMVKNVEITMDNPGSFATGTTVSARILTNSGDVYSTDSGTVESGENTSIYCEVSGSKIQKTYVKTGDTVKKGQLLATLKNNSLYTNRKSSELNLRSSKKTLENYNITAPISGTVITKNSKQGDKIDNSNSNTTLMVIADMSKMKFTITVDELDVAKIKIGQKAIVDADAIENKFFEGRVTKISAEGVSTGNGVTTFDVEIVIDAPGELKSGMNVNANIVINEATDALMVPSEAVIMQNNKAGFVLVKSDSKTKKESQPDKTSKSKNTQDGSFPQMSMEIPSGYELKRVTTGVSDGTYTEIKSGLKEGDEIIYIAQMATSSGFMFPGMGAMHGRMMQGGTMPSGGANRMPSGGANRPAGVR